MDHVLFVVALYLNARNWPSLITQVTTFTLAHTITLALASLGLVTAPMEIIEPLIAVSITVLAMEAILFKGGTAWRLPVVFVFDEPLLRRLQLSVNRLVFLAQSVAELSTRREVQLWLGDPVEVLQGRQLAATFAPVPGWKTRAARLDVVALHPWPWLERPRAGSISSYSAWNKGRR
jgi:hypothetical protein